MELQLTLGTRKSVMCDRMDHLVDGIAAVAHSIATIKNLFFVFFHIVKLSRIKQLLKIYVYSFARK